MQAKKIVNFFHFAEVIIFGGSNVLKNLKRIYGPRVIPTFYFSQLKQNIFKYFKQEKFIIIHNLTNDVTFLHKNSNVTKNIECFRLASDFSDFVIKICTDNPNSKIIVSKILPRFDFLHLNNAGKIINEEITKLLHQYPNVYLISNDHLEDINNFLDDLYHIRPFAFDKMYDGWKNLIMSFTG